MKNIIKKMRKLIGFKGFLKIVNGDNSLESEKGMEMIQVAILIAIAIILGFIFKSEITSFVNKTFQNLNEGF